MKFLVAVALFLVVCSGVAGNRDLLNKGSSVAQAFASATASASSSGGGQANA